MSPPGQLIGHQRQEPGPSGAGPKTPTARRSPVVQKSEAEVKAGVNDMTVKLKYWSPYELIDWFIPKNSTAVEVHETEKEDRWAKNPDLVAKKEEKVKPKRRKYGSGKRWTKKKPKGAKRDFTSPHVHNTIQQLVVN